MHSKYSSGYVESDLAGNGNPFGTDLSAYSVLPQQYKQKQFTRTDLTFDYAAPEKKFSINALVRNVENNSQTLTVPQNINAPGVGIKDWTTVRVSDPRTYGVRLSLCY